MSRSSPIILGLDPSIANTGYGIISGDRVLSSGVLKTESGLPEAVRVWTIFSDVADLVSEFEVSEVAIERFRQFFRTEGAGNGGANALESFRGGSPSKSGTNTHYRSRVNPRSMFLLQAAQTSCLLPVLMAGKPAYLYGVSEWKGGSRVSKKEIKSRVKLLYGLDVANDNVADAIMIAHHHKLARRLPNSQGIRISSSELDRVRDVFFSPETSDDSE